MIKSKNIQIKKITDFDNLYIEQELKNLGPDVIRWAVIEVDDEFLTVTISYI